MGRRSIWSNEDIIELSKQFVPATDEVWRLQNGSDPECRHFQKISEVGHYRNHKSSRQGIYVSTPSGILLGSMNTHNADAVLRMMKQGLEKYQAMPPEKRKLPAGTQIRPTHRWEDSYQTSGLDLTMYARDLPETCHPNDQTSPSWNQDRVWFSQYEARRFLPADRAEIVADTDYDLPRFIVSRMARFSVIDTVKGQTSYYSRDEVADSKLSIHIDELSETTATMSIQGSASAQSEKSRGRDYPHGIKTKLLGRAVYDFGQNKFQQFELVGLGTRWGRTVFNGRSRQLDESPVGFVFRITPADAPLIAPSFLFAYQAEWVTRPK